MSIFLKKNVPSAKLLVAVLHRFISIYYSYDGIESIVIGMACRLYIKANVKFHEHACV